MQNNEHPSIERIFNLVEMQRHAVGVSFMPDTKSYEKYQTGVTVLHVLIIGFKNSIAEYEKPVQYLWSDKSCRL